MYIYVVLVVVFFRKDDKLYCAYLIDSIWNFHVYAATVPSIIGTLKLATIFMYAYKVLTSLLYCIIVFSNSSKGQMPSTMSLSNCCFPTTASILLSANVYSVYGGNTERPSDVDIFSVDAGHIEEIGALLLGVSPYAWWRGLPHGRGSLQPVTSEYPHTSRLSGQRNDSLLQNRRQDTLQAKRHTNNA